MSEETGDGKTAEGSKDASTFLTGPTDLAKDDNLGGVMGNPAVLGVRDKSESYDVEEEDWSIGVWNVADGVGGGDAESYTMSGACEVRLEAKYGCDRLKACIRGSVGCGSDSSSTSRSNAQMWDVEAGMAWCAGMGMGMRGPSVPGEKRWVPKSDEEEDVCFEDVVADESPEEADPEEEEKSMSRACGEGVFGTEEPPMALARGEEGTARWRIGTPRDLLRLCDTDLPLVLDLGDGKIENLKGLLARRACTGKSDVGAGVGISGKCGSVSRLDERERRPDVAESFPTLEEPAKMPMRGLGLGVGIDLIDVGSSSTPPSPRRPLVPCPLPRSHR
jgi:hypothetical protein